MTTSKIVLKAKSSSSKETYNVEFIYGDGLVTVYCNCQAGIFNKLCRHKLALASGDTSVLADPTQNKNLEEVLELLDQVGTLAQIKSISQELDNIQIKKQSLTKQEKKLKAEIEKILTVGQKEDNVSFGTGLV